MNKEILSIAYYGIPGSFTYGAAITYFGDSSDYVGSSSFKEVFSKIAQGECEYGVVPIENTLAGSIYQNYDLLEEFKLSVVGEISKKVEQSLLVSKFVPETSVDDITDIYSHTKAIEQCSVFLDKHPSIVQHAYTDTASAAKFVSEQKNGTIAAIASRECVDIYDLIELSPNIEDNEYNYTRFLVVSKYRRIIEGANKCSLVIHLAHVSGSLSKAMSYLTDAGLNLTKIESRPLESRPFEYTFYLDFVYDEQDQDIEGLLQKFKDNVEDMRILGLYKKDTSSK